MCAFHEHFGGTSRAGNLLSCGALPAAGWREQFRLVPASPPAGRRKVDNTISHVIGACESRDLTLSAGRLPHRSSAGVRPVTSHIIIFCIVLLN